MNRSALFIYTLTLILITSCSKSIQVSRTVDYEAIAREKYGQEAYSCEDNPAESFVLCKHQISDQSEPFKSWEYFVYDKLNKAIVLENSVEKGNVKWFSNTELEVTKTPGTMAQGQTMEDYTWILDIISGKRTQKSKYEQIEDH